MRIELFNARHLDAVVDLSLRAWEPVFASIRTVMDPEVYREHHRDWKADQRAAVTETCGDESMHVWVAIEGDAVTGFVAVRLHDDVKMGEIYMIAVDPDFQRRGTASALSDFALDWMKDAGMTTAMVETGGDPGHAPARGTYEKAGFRELPISRYFKKL